MTCWYASDPIQIVFGCGFAVVGTGFARGMCALSEAVPQVLDPVCFEEEC